MRRSALTPPRIFLFGLLVFVASSGALWATPAPASATPDPAIAGFDNGSDEDSDLSGSRRVFVDCDRGRTLSRALRKSGTVLHIEFSGTCAEDVVIERNSVRITGVGEDPTLQGSVSIRNSVPVTLAGFRIVGSTGSGVEVFNGSSAVLTDLVIEGSALRGINIRNSAATLSNLTVSGSGLGGLVIRGSRTTWSGTFDMSNNELIGISLTDTSNAFIKDATIVSDNNPTGVSVQLSSTFALLDNSTLQTNGNFFAGIFVSSYASFVYANSSLEARDNTFLGVWLEQKSTFSAFSGLTPATSLTGNGLGGILAEKDSIVELNGGATITDNLFGGVLLDNSAVQMSGAVVQDNAAVDVILRFGAKATFVGTDTVVGLPLDCDDTVMTRGQYSCSATAGETSALEGGSRSWQSPPRPDFLLVATP